MTRAWLLCAVAFAGSQALADVADRHSLTNVVDTSFIVANSDLPSWLQGGSGKLRNDEDNDGLQVNRVFFDIDSRISNTLFGHLTLDAYNNYKAHIDVTEAFVEWRPVPRNAWRVRARIGGFYPGLSLENSDPAWGNPYLLSNSVINSWIGEELRTVGMEIKLVRNVGAPGQHQVSVEGAAFVGNDPTGAILAWRGWAAHDGQTGLNGQIPMPQNAVIAPWAPSGNPLPDYDPFMEIDNDPGYYVGAQWRWTDTLRLKVFHYDNQADPEAFSGEDYAWETWFTHVGAQLALPGDIGLLAQWIDGSTRMGPDLGPWRVQDLDFRAAYLTLTKTFGGHRLSARVERFDTQPYNDPAGITNQDKGGALAVSWLYSPNRHIRLGAEYLSIRSDHCASETCAWVFNGLPRSTRESQLQFSLRWYLNGSNPQFR